MSPHSVVLAGFGNIGQAITETIADKHPAADDLVIAGISDPRFGTIVDPAGLDAALLLEAARSRGSFEGLAGVVEPGEVLEAIDRSNANSLLELTFTDLETGEPATTHVRHALSRGLNVSTTNKGPIALHLGELEELASAHDVSIHYEGTVMSGTPTVLVAKESIRAAGFRGAVGILNGTTNYVICRMEQGVSYPDALVEAQKLGYAEADPSGDVDGHDAAGKLSILTSVLTGNRLVPTSIERVSLNTLTASDIETAREQGSVWRYVAALEMSDNGWAGVVSPRLLDDDHPLASVTGATNAITFSTDLLGDVTLSGPGAGRHQTAYSVLNDIARIRTASRP